MRSACGWRYEGVLHEYLVCDRPHTKPHLAGLTYHRLGGGARSLSRDKFLHDAAVLQAALEHEPNHARYVFYLAQSWRDAGRLEEALATYRRRASLGGWAEEVWYSLAGSDLFSVFCFKDPRIGEDHFVRAPACRIALERGLHVRGQPPAERRNTPQEFRSANLTIGCP